MTTDQKQEKKQPRPTNTTERQWQSSLKSQPYKLCKWSYEHY